MSPSTRLHLDGLVVCATWGTVAGLMQRYLLLDDLEKQVVAIPEYRLVSSSLAMWGFLTNPPVPEVPAEFVALNDVRQANPIADVLPELEPLRVLALVGEHVCSPGQAPA